MSKKGKKESTSIMQLFHLLKKKLVRSQLQDTKRVIKYLQQQLYLPHLNFTWNNKTIKLR